ncbi:MAG: hypothetical protein HYR94_15295 [Chloroflexi bacterium]|nr:hypothetical protein [Chloroflexota bacterium]
MIAEIDLPEESSREEQSADFVAELRKRTLSLVPEVVLSGPVKAQPIEQKIPSEEEMRTRLSPLTRSKYRPNEKELIAEAINILKYWYAVEEIAKETIEKDDQLKERQEKIEKEIKRLGGNGESRKLRKEQEEINKSRKKQVLESQQKISELEEEYRHNNPTKEIPKGKDETVKEVEPEVKKKSAQEKLCPPLKNLTNNMFEIVKVITPVLIGLAVTGVISVSVSGLFVAGAAVLVSEMTVAAFCDDVTVKKAV